jgi:hypothetical protein
MAVLKMSVVWMTMGTLAKISEVIENIGTFTKVKKILEMKTNWGKNRSESSKL